MRNTVVRLTLICSFVFTLHCAFSQMLNIEYTDVLASSSGSVIGFCSSEDISYILIRDNHNRYFIQIYDLSNIHAPDYLAAIQLPYLTPGSHYEGIKVGEECLCVFRSDLILFYDLTDRYHPTWVSDIHTSESYLDAGFSDTNLFVLLDDILFSYNVSDIAHPVVLDSVSCVNSSGLFLSGETAYVGYYNSGYQVLDISDPANIQIIGVNLTSSNSPLCGVEGDLLIVANIYSIILYNASDPMNLEQFSDITPGVSKIGSVFLLGNKIYATFYMELYHYTPTEYRVYDISDPHSPTLTDIGSTDLSYEVLSDRSQRILIKRWDSFRLFDIDQVPLAGVTMRYACYENLAVCDNRLIASNSHIELSAYPLSLRIIEPDFVVPFPDIRAMESTSDVLVISQSHPIGVRAEDNSENLISLYLLSAPDHLNPITDFICAGDSYPTREIGFSGSKLLLSNGKAGVMIYDIDDIDQPEFWCGIADQYSHTSSVLSGDRLYSAVVSDSSSSSVIIYDLSDTRNVTTLSTIPFDFPVNRILKVGSKLVIAGSDSTLAFWDVEDPENPIEIGVKSLPSNLVDLYVHTNAMVILFQDHFEVYRFSALPSGDPVGFYPTDGKGLSITYRGNDIIVGTDISVTVYEGRDAFNICNSSGEDPFAIPQIQNLETYPNPSRDFTMIGYELREPAAASVEIFNLRGQRLISMYYEDQDAGPQLVGWDGKNDQGESCGDGVYLYRIVSKGYYATGRLIRLRQ